MRVLRVNIIFNFFMHLFLISHFKWLTAGMVKIQIFRYRYFDF